MKKLFLALSAFLAASSWAACPQFYPKNIAKPFNTVELCSSFYVSRFDVNNKATVMVVELLEKSKGTPGASRINEFAADKRVGKSSPTNADYMKSGYDRGHMAPAGDASDSAEMHDTFLLTNMTPQEPTLNRNSWRVMEEQIRKEFDAGSVDFKIVTLAMYNKPKRIGVNIPVPMSYWKIVYKKEVPTKFFFAENKPNAPVKQYDLIDVNKLIKNSTNF
jgi:endonuclease G